MKIGYARVSTDDQTLDLQHDALRRAKCKEIYEEHASGKNTARPQLEASLKSLRDGDTLVVWRLDRFARSLVDLIRLNQELQTRGIGFSSLTEQIDTTVVVALHPDNASDACGIHGHRTDGTVIVA